MYRSLAIFTGCLIAFNLSACSNGQSVQSGQSIESSQSGPPKLVWPHSRPLSAKEEEEFNTNYTTLEGTLKQCSGNSAQKEWSIFVNENDICFLIPRELYSKFDSNAFGEKTMASVKQGRPANLKFLVEHLEAEQPHADPKTGKLTMKVHGILVGDDNIDLIKSQD